MSDEPKAEDHGILGRAKRLVDQVGEYVRSDESREKLDVMKKNAIKAGGMATAGAKRLAEGTKQAAAQAKVKAHEFSKSERGEALKAKAREGLARFRAGSFRDLRPWQSPVVIGLSLLMCFPVGLLFVWRHPAWSTARKWTWTGAWAATTFLFLVVAGYNQGRKDGEKTFAEAETLWAAGDRAGAVAKYRDITDRYSSFLDSAKDSTAFGRTIEFDVERGDTDRAKALMKKALDASVPLPDLGGRAMELLSSARAEREEARSQADPMLEKRRSMLAEGDALWDAGRADDALKKYREFWKSYYSWPHLAQEEKATFGPHLPALYERTMEDYLASYLKRPRELQGELREAGYLVENASDNGISLPEALVQKYRALKATPAEELTEPKTYSVSEGFERGKITVEITDQYDIGLELKDFTLGSTGILEFTAVWNPERNGAPGRSWAAYDAGGVKLSDGILSFGQAIKAGEPTRGEMVIGYDKWKSTTRIKID
mgnify:CR=1 FL=1